MKTILFIVLTCFTTLFAAERCDIAAKMAGAKECVATLSKNHQEVAKVCASFSDELLAAYKRGEGMIDQDIGKIFDAVNFAAFKHQFQTRKDLARTPYIIHPIRVAKSLLTTGGVRDPDILIAALLHDTVEDTDTTFEEIRAKFGPRVEGFVKEVTDDKRLDGLSRKRLQVEHAPEKSAGAAMIKLADKNDNLTNMQREPIVGWPKERIDAYFKWAKQVTDALPWVNGSLKKAVDLTLEAHGVK